MRIEDICDGCSKHIAFCMCRTSIGIDGVKFNNPKPAKMADKLQIITEQSKLHNHSIKTKSIADQIRWKAAQAAQRGYFFIEIWLNDINLTKEAAEMVVKELQDKDGFKCTISDEITNQYSNTDYDTELLLQVSWKKNDN